MPTDVQKRLATDETLARIATALEAQGASYEPRVIALIDRWLRFNPSNKKGLIIKAGTYLLKANGSYQHYATDTAVDLTSYISSNGADYLVYLANDGTVSAYPSSTSQPANTVKIGRFHTLCVNVGTITNAYFPAQPSSGYVTGGSFLVKPYDAQEDPDFYTFYNKTITGVTVQTHNDRIACHHPLSGFTAGSILPESVFCLTFYPNTLYEDGMVYDKSTGRAVDIYLQSGKGNLTKSVYGATHTVSRMPICHQSDMRAVGKKLLSDYEFESASIGSNEGTNITGSSDKTTVGGHVDTNSRRMISAIGCEEMCGYLYQWIDELAPTGGSGWNSYGDGDYFGKSYGMPYVLVAGGNWNNGAFCGSRCRFSNGVRSDVYDASGARGSSQVIRSR